MIIRRAEATDLSAVRAFYSEVVPRIESEVTSWIPGVYPSTETAEAAIAAGACYLAFIESKVVGSVILNHEADEEYADIAWHNPKLRAEQVLIIHTLMTSPTHRKKGIAASLLNYAIDLAKSRKCQAVRLDTFVANFPARQLYEKLGFRNCGVGELPSWDGQGVDQCVFFELDLANK